jgi:hypothetical protein
MILGRMLDAHSDVGSSDRWARTLCALAALLLVWQHCCWWLIWMFGATSYYPATFHFLSWIRILLASCNTRLMCLHVVFRDRVISD